MSPMQSKCPHLQQTDPGNGETVQNRRLPDFSRIRDDRARYRSPTERHVVQVYIKRQQVL